MGDGTKALLAKCVYEIEEPLPEITFDIAFNIKTSRFKSIKTSVVQKTLNTYEVKNTVSVVPKKFVGAFSVIFTGDTTPNVTCSPLRITTPPKLSNKFEATVLDTRIDNGLTRLKAVCEFSVNQTCEADTKNFMVGFDSVVYRFEHWVMKKIVPISDAGRWFHMTNLHRMNQPKLEFRLQANYKGDTLPRIYCSSDLARFITTTPTTTTPVEPTTTESPTAPPSTKETTTKPNTIEETSGYVQNKPDLPFIFPATIFEHTWPENGMTGFEGLCTYAVDQTYGPQKHDFLIDFSLDVENFKNWVGLSMYPLGNYGRWFYMTNLYWIHADKLEFKFKASFTGAVRPDVLCGGTLPPYGDTVVTTRQPKTTTKGPKTTTTQGPKTTTTKGPKTTTTQGPKTTTTKGPKTTTTQGPKTTTTQGPKTTTTQGPVTERTTTLPPDSSYNYYEVLMKSIWFYRAQRSGKLPEVANDPVPWRGDSALYDGDDVNRDLTGGWYDAGDWVKFNFPISSATATLGWGLVQWKDAYVAAGLYESMVDNIKWSLDFFLKCWDPANKELYGQVGLGQRDHDAMMRPEDMTPSNMPRPAYKVTTKRGGSDLAGSVVAAFAAGAIAFRDKDSAYSSLLLQSAKSLYSFADDYRALYTGEIWDAESFYPSSGYEDELVYAAAMLYKATEDQYYLDEAKSKYAEFGFDNQTSWAFDWNDKLLGAKLLLYEATNDTMYARDVRTFLDDWRPQGSLQYTPGGLAWRSQWGSLRYSANTAFIALVAADLGIDTDNNVAWAKGQIHYMLGDNPRHASYVVGFGNRSPKQPHHKSSICAPKPASCDWGVYSDTSKDNYNTIFGALVGGPDANDNYQDVRTDHLKAEVTCDYNAGFQSSVAGLIHFKYN